MQGAIIYKGKYGATRDYAGFLSKELDLPVSNETLTGGQLINSDYILIGSSVYVGKLSLRKWLIRHQEWLKQKKLFFFIVCGTPASDHKKTDKIISDNIPPALRHNEIFFLRGRLIIRQLSWADRLLLRMGASLTKDPQQKKEMLQDFDDVEVSRIRPMVKAVKEWEQAQQERVLQVLG